MKLQLPYHARKTQVSFADKIVEVKAYQIIVWVGVTLESFPELGPTSPRFPAILDTGNNHNFAITEQQLNAWAGLLVDSLSPTARIREQGEKIQLRRAALWLHTGDAPFRMNVADGIAVYDGNWPRLPILGLRALTNSKLQTFIYGDTMEALIRTAPPWYWPF